MKITKLTAMMMAFGLALAPVAGADPKPTSEIDRQIMQKEQEMKQKEAEIQQKQSEREHLSREIQMLQQQKEKAARGK